MSEKMSVTAEIALEYWRGQEVAGTVYRNLPVEPEHTEELIIAVRSEDADHDPRKRVVPGRPQVHLAGTPRALEAFGRYLIALARTETIDAGIHEHFEDVQNDDGGTVHLVVRRIGEPIHP